MTTESKPMVIWCCPGEGCGYTKLSQVQRAIIIEAGEWVSVVGSGEPPMFELDDYGDRDTLESEDVEEKPVYCPACGERWEVTDLKPAYLCQECQDSEDMETVKKRSSGRYLCDYCAAEYGDSETADDL